MLVATRDFTFMFWPMTAELDYLSIPECIINKLNYGYYTCSLVWLSTYGQSISKQHTFPLNSRPLIRVLYYIRSLSCKLEKCCFAKYVVVAVVDVVFVTLPRNREGVIFSLQFACVCLSVCLSVSEQNSSWTDAQILTQFSLNDCLLHWLEPY